MCIGNRLCQYPLRGAAGGVVALHSRFASDSSDPPRPTKMLYLVNALSQGFVAAPAVGKSVVARSTSANMLYGEPRPVQIIPSVLRQCQKRGAFFSQIALPSATEPASGRSKLRSASA